MRLVLAAAIAAAAAAGLPAQEPGQDPAAEPAPNPFGHSRHGEPFDEGPRQAAYLMPGLGTAVHLPVAGLSDAAQAFFDQGVTQLHGFWYFEAERSFRQVAKLHPDCAMAYWGMAMANVENRDRAVGLIANAVERSSGAPRYAALWIDAWARYYGIDDAGRGELQSGDAARTAAAKKALAAAKPAAGADKPAKEERERRLIKDLGTLVYEFPDDVEAKAFLALQNWLASDWGSGVRIVSHTAVDALLDQVFAARPRHPAHHYRIHLWDQEVAERAVRSAAVIGHTAPAIAHQWHMGGHIFDKLKRYDDAAWQQEASSRVDHAHMMRDRVMPFEIHNYGHNQEWLCRTLQNLGRAHEALDLAKNMVELPRHPKKNALDDRRGIAGYGRTRLLQVCTTFELWDELRAACEGGLVDASDNAEAAGERLLALGTAAFRQGDLDAGDRAVGELDAVLARARRERGERIDRAEDDAVARGDDAKAVAKATREALEKGSEPVRALRDMAGELRGLQALARGDGKAAVAAFAGVSGVPAPWQAEAHALDGDAAKALEVLEKAKADAAGRTPPLVHLVLALHAAGDRDKTAAAFTELRRVAGRADLDTPLLQRLAPVAADLGLPEDWRQPQAAAADSGAAERPPLAELGPARWSPSPAPGFDLAGTDGTRHRLDQHRRPTLVVFYLGFGCLHCVEQLEALAPAAAALTAAGIDIVAIGTDTVDAASESLAALDAADRFPFPLLADPDLAVFKAWRCYDDFEAMPLHGTFLVDADGNVRWQDVSFEPFTSIDWLVGECQRLLALPSGGSGSR